LYSNTDTIILWSDNKEIGKYTIELAKELGVSVYAPDIISDFFAVPGFIRIIDSEKLLELLRISGRNTFIDEYFYFDDCKILVSGQFRFVVTYPLRKNVEFLPEIISKKILLPIIKHSLESAIRESEFRNNQFKKKNFRILTLHHLIESKGNIDIEKLAFRYKLSTKTIGRDLEILKAINPTQSFFSKLTSYKTNKPKNTFVLSKRQIASTNQLKRLIDLYQLLKDGLVINVEKTCAKYKITERSIRRDIKLLRDVNPERKIIYDKIKGYY
jgi:hypothetical protein